MSNGKSAASQIADDFINALEEIAQASGLKLSRRARLKERIGAKYTRNTIVVYKDEGESRIVYWIIYYKVSAVDHPRFFWGLTPKILQAIASGGKRLDAAWGVILLAGSHQNGYFLSPSDVDKGKRHWPVGRKDGNYKIDERILDHTNSACFATMDGLKDILRFPVAEDGE